MFGAISDAFIHSMIYLLDGLKTLTGNYGWAIIIFAAIVKAALYFPTQSQFKQMKEMQKVQPAMKKLQERYKGDPQKLQVEQMALFKKYNVNPLAGCLPILIQMPILIGIYATIRKMAELGRFANETFLWIGGPLSNIYPSLFGGSLAHKDTLLLVIYGFSMYLSQKMSVGVSDPSNESTQKIMGLAMPVMFTVFLWNFPSSLILYWLVFNILSVAQQYFTMRDAGTAGQEIQESTPDEADTAPDADMETPQGRSRSRSRKKKGGN